MILALKLSIKKQRKRVTDTPSEVTIFRGLSRVEKALNRQRRIRSKIQPFFPQNSLNKETINGGQAEEKNTKMQECL